MKPLPGPHTELSTNRRELVGQQIDLPGRYPIITDGQSHDLDCKAKMETCGKSQDQADSDADDEITAMLDRVRASVRKRIKGDGRNTEDWKYTVMIAVHHKGQATDFWFGDAPDIAIVDKNLPENMHKPINGQQVRIEKR